LRHFILARGINVMYSFLAMRTKPVPATKKPLALTYGMEVRGKGFPDYTPKITVFTVEGYARKNKEDPAAAVKRAIENGHELTGTTGGMSVMTDDYPGKAEAHAKALKETAAAPVLDNGELVEIEGRTYAVRLVGANYSDPIHFKPVPLAPGTTGYHGTYPVTIVRHIAHGTYAMRLAGGEIIEDVPDLKPLPPKGTYYARGKEALKGGSFFRATGRKREAFAIYNLGDFVGFTATLPDEAFPVMLDAKTAKGFLPLFLR